jgi:hypothetical protein
VEHNQVNDIVKHSMELLTNGFMTQAGKELLTAIIKQFDGQPTAKQAIAELQAKPTNSPNAARTLEVLLEAEIIKDNELQELIRKLLSEGSQKMGVDLTAMESVEICDNQQSIEGFPNGSQVLGEKIKAPNIKISNNTQSQK